MDLTSIASRIAIATTFDRAAKLTPEALVEAAATHLAAAGITDSRAGLVIDAHIDDERWAGLVPVLQRRRELPVIAVEARSGLHGKAALASLDKEESRVAVSDTESMLRRAAAVGAAAVVLRLGWVEGARRDWTFARDSFLRASLSPQLQRGLQEARNKVAHGHLDRARAALDRLCRTADSVGVKLLLKNGQRYVELPSPRELDVLREELRGAPIQAMLDLPAAHLPDRMGMMPLAVTIASFGGGSLAYLGDACAAIGALPPGNGELAKAQITAQVVKSTALAFRPWPQLRATEIVSALKALAA